MATELCFFGPSHCGKTTLALKTAQVLAKEHSVILVFCDRVAPHLPWLFPRYRTEDIKSVGTALSAVEMTDEKLMSSATVGKNPNLVFLGYCSGENRFSYPDFGPGRANVFFDRLDNLAEYVLTDCTADVTSDVLTEIALKRAAAVFRIYTPDMASFAFYDAQLPVLSSSEYHPEQHVRVLNCAERDVCLPEQEAAASLGDKPVMIPYCKAWRRQRAEGTLTAAPVEKKAEAALKRMLSVLPG